MINRYRFPLFLIAISLASLSSAIPAKGDVSLIETAQKSLPAIVSVTAEITGIAQGGRPAAAIDKATGRMIILRNVKAAHLKRVGAGVIIDPSGLIATNVHTIANAQKITIAFNDGTQVTAQVVQYFPQEDFALLSINPPYPLSSIEFADSDNIRLGEEVITVGNSELLSQTISGGKIIGIGSHNRQKQEGVNTDMIQTNINVYKGDSGGPLLNRDGQLLGLMVAGQMDVDRSSFAIPSKKIRMHYLEYLRSLSEEKNQNSP
ncbi:MAG TPA: S1C family serine protease [Candidatus Omnitrophota bacterium]|nr:S1C family serine protease [Candidatus Omnitrophota bacterium]HPD85152.1 S1C family serine protease [Candidatus Omnitrophota bacterium]HRZ04347.1 S1C family serine protease [Candidatus Omnitrophota bacterium]